MLVCVTFASARGGGAMQVSPPHTRPLPSPFARQRAERKGGAVRHMQVVLRRRGSPSLTGT